MRVHLVRTGGFAGIRVEREVDSAKLTDEEQGELQRLVQNANFQGLPAVISSEKAGADRFQYDVTVDQDGQRHGVKVDEAAVPDCVLPLLKWVMAKK
jgi:hypothetical protein